jgi:hypothetical protein
LPTEHQGIQFRAAKDPVLYLGNPDGIGTENRRKMLDGLRELHEVQSRVDGGPDLRSRIANYEMAFRMQFSIPDVTDFSTEADATFEMYGPDSRTPGSFGANCLLARRLAERGVRFIQLYHQDWDHHGGLPGAIPRLCRETDQPAAALIRDLKQRGMLDETLVVWGGEFGRTPDDATTDGRGHNNKGYTMWLAGGGVRGGSVHGATDELGHEAVEGQVHIHDLHATILHLLGLDHERLTYRHGGRDYRLTDVKGNVVKAVLA